MLSEKANPKRVLLWFDLYNILKQKFKKWQTVTTLVVQWLRTHPPMQWLKVKVKVLVASVVSDSATTWTVAHQAPLSMEFSKQEYWNRSPCPLSRDLPNPGIKPWSAALQADSLPSEPPGKTPPPLQGTRVQSLVGQLSPRTPTTDYTHSRAHSPQLQKACATMKTQCSQNF